MVLVRNMWVIGGLTALVLLTTVGCGHAPGEKKTRSWQDIQGSEGAEEEETNPSILTLLSESKHTYDSANSYVSEWVHEYRILTEQAKEYWGMARIAWSPWRQDKPTIEATVTLSDGTVVPLDPSTIAEQGNNRTSDKLISGSRTLVAPLPQLEVGATVRVKMSVKTNPSAFGPGEARQHFFGAVGRNVELSRLVIDTPVEMEITSKQLGIEIEPDVQVAGDRKVSTYEQRNLKRIPHPDSFLPRDMVVVPYINFTTAKSWSQLAKHYSRKMAPVMDTSQCEDQLAKLAGKKLRNERDQVAQVLANMRRSIRYTGLELGENAIIPTNPCETIKRGFGDCKDQAALVVATLRNLDIEAEFALVDSSDSREIEPDIPTLLGFTHVIVRIPGRDPLWFDPTSTYSRPNELSYGTLDRWALIIDDDTDEIVKTPQATSSMNSYSEQRTYTLPLLGEGEVIETSTYGGAIEHYERSNAKDTDDKKLRENLSNYVESTYSAKNLVEAKKVDVNNLDEPFGYYLKAEDSELVQSYTDGVLVVLHPQVLFTYAPNDFDPRRYDKKDLEEERKGPYEIYLPQRIELLYKINLPEGFAYPKSIKDDVRKIPPFSFGVTFEQQNKQTMLVKYSLDTGNGQVTADQYAEIRKELLDWYEKTPSRILFEIEGLQLLEEKKHKKAFAKIQSLVSGAPKEAVYRLWYANALLETGFGAAAQEELRKATRLAPDLVDGWTKLGWAMEHNYLGERFGKGYDRKGAIEAYEHALKIDSDDLYARFSLAILHEHDEKGRRYMEKDQVEKAVAHYRKLLEDEETDEKDSLQLNLLACLLNIGDYKGALDLLENMPEDDHNSTQKLIAIAGLHGAARALEESTKLLEDGATRRLALRSAGEELARNRRYKDALELTKASMVGQNAVEERSLLELLGKAEIKEEIGPPPKTVKELGQHFVWHMISRNHKVLTEMILPSELFESKELVDAIISGVDSVGLLGYRMEVLRDLTMANLDLKAKGDDERGYLITMEGGKMNLSYFSLAVAKVGGAYKIVDIGASGTDAARLLKHLDEGKKLEEVRFYLDGLTEANRVSGLRGFWTVNCEGSKEKARAALWKILSKFEGRSKDLVVPVQKALKDPAYKDMKDKLQILLLDLYNRSEDYKRLSQESRKMIDAEKEVPLALLFLTWASKGLDDFFALETITKELLQTNPDHKHARRAYENILFFRDDPEEYVRELEKPEWENHLSATDYNNMAWAILFTSRNMDRALELSMKSLKNSRRTDITHLHTLATIYAEMANTNEALQLLRRILSTRKGGEPTTDDWYIIGRLAEHFNLKKVAKDAYKRVEKPEEPSNTSTYILAKKRLAGL